MYLQLQCLVTFIANNEVVHTSSYHRFFLLFPEVTINNMSAIHPAYLAFRINMSFLPQWHKEYLEKAMDQNKLWRSLWNNSGSPKTHCCMKLITTSTTALHWRKLILILPSVNISHTQTDEFRKKRRETRLTRKGVKVVHE